MAKKRQNLSTTPTKPALRSMTGFAQSKAIVQGLTFFLEAKSLNHRYCEVSYRGPRELTGLEPMVVQHVQKHISRGRVEVNLSLKGQEARSGLKVNVGRAKALFAELEGMRKRLSLKGATELKHLLAFRDQFVEEATVEVSSEIWPKLQPAFDQLMDHLMTMRAQEGKSIQRDLMHRLGILKTLRKQMIVETEAIENHLYGRIKERLAEALREQGLAAKVDEGRLVQEVAFYVERADVKEELSRLDSHFEQMDALLLGPSPVGRKMDFLVQEIHRELNTLGAKSGSVPLTQMVIEAKTELERIREQIQNVE